MTDDFLFSCSADCPRFFSQALVAIAWRQPENQSCSVDISRNGLLFLTEDASVLQASVLLRSTLFRSYAFLRTDPYDMRVNLTSLVNCLNVFAETATSMDISCEEGSDLRVRIHDMGSTTDCSIRTQMCPPEQPNRATLSDAFSRDSTEIVSFVIGSAVVREMFRFPNERRNKSVGIDMTIDPERRLFEVKAEGAFGVVRSVISFAQPDFQRVKLDIMEPFTASYPVWALTPVLNAMQFSYETKFRFRDNGMLAVQQGIKGTQGIETIVEFILQPTEDTSVL